MWMAIGVGILLTAQAGASPAIVPPQGASAPATTGAETEAPATELPAAGNDTTLRFRNDVGNTFQMTEARFTLDGQDLPSLLTNAAPGQEFVIFSGPLSPGHHIVTARITYQSKSRSIFTYMKGYTFNLGSTHELDVATRGATKATIVGKPNKGFNVPFERSLMVVMEQSTPIAGSTTNEVSSGYRPPR